MTRSANSHLTLLSIVSRLRAGAQVSDADFDRLFPDWVRPLSDMHWTPVAVARLASRLLAVHEGSRVLDVGSGVGKFCLIGALATRATFVGIEQRSNLVDVSRQTALHQGIASARFLHGNALDMDWSEFDGVYLYNPYYENICDCLTPVEGGIELDPERYRDYVVATYVKLLSARVGTRVATYHGFGGVVPAGYRLILRDTIGTGSLEVWEKSSHLCAPPTGSRTRPDAA